MKKIILIDDNKSNQREIYGASFVDMEEYEMMQAKLKLLHELSRGEASLHDGDPISLEEAAAQLGVSI